MNSKDHKPVTEKELKDFVRKISDSTPNEGFKWENRTPAVKELKTVYKYDPKTGKLLTD